MKYKSRIIYEKRRDARRRSSLVPFLRLRGKWLERAGFGIGEDVEVYVAGPGRLVIEKRKP